MKAPPIIEYLQPEQIESSGGRDYLGWIGLVLMFGFVLAGALTGSANRSANAQSMEFDERLKSIVRSELPANSAISKFSGLEEKDPKVELRELEKDLSKQNKPDELGFAVHAAVLTEQKLPVPSSIYVRLLSSKKDIFKTLGKIYSSPTLTPAAAKFLGERLNTNSMFVARLASAQAMEKAGLKESRANLVPKESLAMLAILSLASLGILGGCVLAWFGYISARIHGELQPLGLIQGRISLPHADRLAVRAAQLFAGFLGIEVIVYSIFRSRSVDPGPALLESGLMLAYVFVLPRVPLGTGRLALADLGVTLEGFWKHVAWGVVGFVAELPVAIVLSLAVTKVLKFLPTPEHPASQQLQLNHDPWVVLSILVLGTIVAPIWEEIMFRGLLFPALSRIFKSVPMGAVVSSLIFASIHPQGAALWLALGMTGLMGCALTYQTRSLVPSMVMHFCHNATLMILTILIT